MRVLLLAQFYPPVIGGEERHVRNLGQALASRGHDVCVVTLRHGDDPAEEWDGLVRVHRVRGLIQSLPGLFTDPRHAHAPPVPDPRAAAAIARIAAAFRPDVVHAHNWFGRSFLPLKRPGGPALVLTLHDYGLACPKKSLMLNGSPCAAPTLAQCLSCARTHYGPNKGAAVVLANRVGALAETALVDRVLAVSHAVANGNRLAERGLPFEIVPNFIPDTLQAAEDSRDPRLGLLPDQPFMLFVGDLRRIKGVHVLLDAYARLGPEALPLVLIGRDCGEIARDWPPGVRHLESWPHPLVLAAWAKATIGVAPSTWPEPCATVVMEGMTMNTPMIVSRTGGMTDLIAHDREGLVVTPGDPEALAAGLRRLVTDVGLRLRLATAAKLKVAGFTESAVVPRIEAAYATALARRSVPARSAA